MQVLYSVVKGIGLFLLLMGGMCLIGWFLGYISFKLGQIKPIAAFSQWCKKVFEKLTFIGMLIFAVLFAIGIIIKFFQWIVIGVLAIGHFFTYLYHLVAG